MKRVKHLIHCPDNCSGKDVVVVVMDSGAVLHPELLNCFLIFKDMVNGKQKMYDDNGHGTHVCGIIAGRHIGIAPECKLIVLKVLDEQGHGSVETSMRGFRWILENQEKYNIRIVNISMGMKAKGNSLEERRILSGVELLWDMGMIVVAAAGNMGPEENSITVPGIDSKIITVGAYDLHSSSRGSVAKKLWKPDLVVPGANVLSCNARWKEKDERMFVKKSGTSMATPIVTGAIANLLSKNSNLPNEEVKAKLKASCDTLGLPNEWQGNGVLNLKKLLR